MRYLVYLFSFYMIVISIMPCQDEVCLEDTTTQIVNYGDNHQEDRPHEDNSLCGFDCLCECCGYTLIYQQSDLKDINLFQRDMIQQQNTVYKDQYIFGFDSSIWQPPRIMG